MSSAPPIPTTETVSPPRLSLLGQVWYETVRWTFTLLFSLRGGVRVTGREHIPREGGVLIVSNHLSFLDPIVIGLGVPRPMKYVTRATLFKPILAALLRSLGSVPIDREGGGTAGLKATLRLLKVGWVVLIFPEGTRSPNGELGPLKPGFAALTRARVPILPAAVVGTFEAWPRGQALPRAHPIRVHFDAPILPDSYASLSPDELTSLVLERLRTAQIQARASTHGSQDGASTS